MTDYDHCRKVTNPDFELSDCYDCKRNEGGMCWIAGCPKRYVAQTAMEVKRCGYWLPRTAR